MGKRRSIFIALIALPILMLRLTTGDYAVPPMQDLDLEDEHDLITQRARLYLERHGDDGKIEPEERLGRVRQEYSRRQAVESRRGFGTEAVQGNTWTSIGPTNGAGRATALAIHPSEPGTVYVGAAGGGVWKTTDAGGSWVPLTESINDLSVGAVALAPSDPNTVYLGTGEGGLAIDFIPGIGFLKSIDGGANWIFPDSVLASEFFRLSVNPDNSQDLVAGTNKGGWRSTDGGSTWTQVIDPLTYPFVTDIVRHPTKPDVLYATTWDGEQWCARTGGCRTSSARVLKSTDDGLTWTEKSSGIPLSTSSTLVDRMSIAMSQTDPTVMYLATAFFDGSTNIFTSHIFKTTDGGESWTDLPGVAQSSNSNISQFMARQVWYNNTIVVSPTDPNVAIAGGTLYVRTTDGGNNWAVAPFMFTNSSAHVDVHDLRYQGSTLYIANDGGIWTSADDGVTSADHNSGLVTRQYYGLAIDSVNRNRVLGGAQDNGTGRRPDAGGTGWTAIIGGDGFQCGVLASAPDFSYGTVQGALIFRAKNSAVNPQPTYNPITPPYDHTEVVPFLSNFLVDPVNPSTIYTSSYRLWRSSNGGDSWNALPATTTDGSTWLTSSIISGFSVGTDSATIMVARIGIVAGTTVRTVFLSTDGGMTWVSRGHGVPARGINNVQIDPIHPQIAYLAISGTTGPSVYKTIDQGLNWSASASGLPSFSAQVIRVDPTDSNVVYCGTDVGVYRSTDQGATWAPFGTGLPASSVHDMKISDDGTLLRVATHGRGMWELQIPATGNHAPLVAISAPARATIVTKGSALNLTGSISDPDNGDTVTGQWIFPDTWESAPASAGQPSITHTFNNAGIFPVTLLAKDSHGATGATSVFITVHEPFEKCSTPNVVSGAGPFPIVIHSNNETALLTESADPGPPCVSQGSGITHPLWFEFTPQTDGDYEFTTCGSTINLVLSLWTGNPCGPYTAVDQGCNNAAPSGSSCFRTRTADLAISLKSGQTYRLRVNGLTSSEVGPFTLTINKIVPVITSASIAGRNLVVDGAHFDSGAVIVMDGVDQKTLNDDLSPTTALIGKKVGKRIASGQTVHLQVRNSSGSTSDIFAFMRN
jgi:photosystem II stability/assembly factor-like uncharacterized protein